MLAKPLRFGRRHFTQLTSLVLVALSLAATAVQPDDLSHHPAMIATLADPAVTESSGLVASPKTPGLLWTLNDSGHPPTLFATNRAGDALATLTVTGATNTDWEDLGAGWSDDGSPVLYLADTGDNTRSRAEIAIYRVPEPAIDPDRAASAVVGETEPAERYRLILPDGASDIEAIVVHPVRREIILLSKESFAAAAVYRVPSLTAPEQPLRVERLADVSLPGFGPLRAITGGAVSAAGNQLAVRTATAAYIWQLPEAMPMAEVLAEPPRRIALPPMPAGEAIAFRADGDALLLTSEGAPAPLYEVALSGSAA